MDGFTRPLDELHKNPQLSVCTHKPRGPISLIVSHSDAHSPVCCWGNHGTGQTRELEWRHTTYGLFIYVFIYLFIYWGNASARMSRSKDNLGEGVLFCDVCPKDKTQVPGLEAGAFTHLAISPTLAVLMGLFLSTRRRDTTESHGLWASSVGSHFT